MTSSIGKKVLVVAALTLAACGGGDGGGAASSQPAKKGGAAPSPSPAAPAALSEEAARKTFESRCGSCHGNTGKGDGPGAAALTPKPRDYTDKEWQKSVTDEQIRKAIVMGGAAVGKSPSMPAAPDLESKPHVVDALVKVVRKFGT